MDHVWICIVLYGINQPQNKKKKNSRSLACPHPSHTTILSLYSPDNSHCACQQPCLLAFLKHCGRFCAEVELRWSPLSGSPVLWEVWIHRRGFSRHTHPPKAERKPLSLWYMRIVYVFKMPGWREGSGLRERSEVMTRKCMFTANTWRTLCKISEPQGCHYTVFLTSATFPSHPKTHDCNANKDRGPALRPETQSQIERHRNVLKTSRFFFFPVFFFFFPSRWRLALESLSCSCAGEPDFWLNQLV